MIMDSKFLKASIKKFIQSNSAFQLLSLAGGGSVSQIDDLINNIKIEQTSLQVIIQFASRFQTYVKSADDLNNDLIELSNSIMTSLGIDYPITLSYPIAGGLGASSIFIFLFRIYQSIFRSSKFFIKIRSLLEVQNKLKKSCCDDGSTWNNINIFTINGKS
jgi:hypothetical protein